MVFNKNNKKEISAIEDLIEAKVYVNPNRYEELRRLRDEIWSSDVAPGCATPCTILCLNPSPAIENALQAVVGYSMQVERICDDPTDAAHKEDRKRFVKLFKKLEASGVGAVVHCLGSQDEELTLLDKRVIALSLLARLPVICVATACPDPLPAASAASGDTWPVFFVPHAEDARQLCEWLTSELPRVRALSAAIESELQSRVAHLAEVNAPLHFLKRASVALVPFGVMTVNFLGILRLMASMLKCVGMRGDTSANRALGLLGAQNAALVTAVDSMGDVYSFAVFTTVLADLQGMGLVEAAAAMDVVDGLMLGSISVVTGAVSALGAYLSRPVVVRAAASFLASLQTIYVLNPAMRRETERRASRRRRRWGRRGRDKATAEEETQGLLQTSRNARPTGPGGREADAAVALAAAEAAAPTAAAAAAYESVPGGEGAQGEGEAASSPSTSSSDEEAEEEEQLGAGGEAAGAPAAGGKDVRAAARAAKKASRLEEKERKRKEKQERREQRVAAKAAAVQRRAAEKAEAAEARAAEKAADAVWRAAAKAIAAEFRAADKEEARLAKEAARLEKEAARLAKAEARAARKGWVARPAAPPPVAVVRDGGGAAGQGATVAAEAQRPAAAEVVAAVEAAAVAATATSAAGAGSCVADDESARLEKERALLQEERARLERERAQLQAERGRLERERARLEEEEAARQAKAEAAKAEAAKAEAAKAAERKKSAAPAAATARPEAAAVKLRSGSQAEAAAPLPCPEAVAFGEKLRWWQRRAGAPASGAAGAAGAAKAEGKALARSNSDSSGDSGDSGGEDGEAGAAARREAEEAARNERMGLDEKTRRALAEFLSLADEDVYESGGDGAAAAGSGATASTQGPRS